MKQSGGKQQTTRPCHKAARPGTQAKNLAKAAGQGAWPCSGRPWTHGQPCAWCTAVRGGAWSAVRPSTVVPACTRTVLRFFGLFICFLWRSFGELLGPLGWILLRGNKGLA